MRSFSLLTSLLVSVSLPAMAATQTAPFAMTDWHVSPVKQANGPEAADYCAMATHYSDGPIVTFTRNAEAKGSIAVDFPNAEMQPNQHYAVSLFNQGKKQTYIAKAINPTQLVLQTGINKPLYDALAAGDALTISLDGTPGVYSLASNKNAFLEFDHCVKALKSTQRDLPVVANIPVAQEALPAPVAAQNPPLIQRIVDPPIVMALQSVAPVQQLLDSKDTMPAQASRIIWDPVPAMTTAATQDAAMVQPATYPAQPEQIDVIAEEPVKPFLFTPAPGTATTFVPIPSEKPPVQMSTILWDNITPVQNITSAVLNDHAEADKSTHMPPPSTGHPTSTPGQLKSLLARARAESGQAPVAEIVAPVPPSLPTLKQKTVTTTTATQSVTVTAPPPSPISPPPVLPPAIPAPVAMPAPIAPKSRPVPAPPIPVAMPPVPAPVVPAPIPQTRQVVFRPPPAAAMSGWKTRSLGASASDKSQGFCLMENRFANDVTLMIGQRADGYSTIGVNYGIDMLQPGRNYAVTVQVDGIFDEDFNGYAESPKTLVVQMGKKPSLFATLPQAQAMRIAMQGAASSFALQGAGAALGEFSDCIVKLGGVPVNSAVAIPALAPVIPVEKVMAAPLDVPITPANTATTSRTVTQEIVTTERPVPLPQEPLVSMTPETKILKVEDKTTTTLLTSPKPAAVSPPPIAPVLWDDKTQDQAKAIPASAAPLSPAWETQVKTWLSQAEIKEAPHFSKNPQAATWSTGLIEGKAEISAQRDVLDAASDALDKAEKSCGSGFNAQMGIPETTGDATVQPMESKCIAKDGMVTVAAWVAQGDNEQTTVWSIEAPRSERLRAFQLRDKLLNLFQGKPVPPPPLLVKKSS